MIRPNPREDYILASATIAYGEQSQINVAYGEAGEFVTLCGRAQQGRATKEDFIDEIADNILMQAQMRRIFGAEAVDARVRYKLDRLMDRITKSEQEKKENKA